MSPTGPCQRGSKGPASSGGRLIDAMELKELMDDGGRWEADVISRGNWTIEDSTIISPNYGAARGEADIIIQASVSHACLSAYADSAILEPQREVAFYMDINLIYQNMYVSHSVVSRHQVAVLGGCSRSA